MPTTELLALQPVLAAEALTLVSPWKPFLVLIPLMGWAWVVSAVYDKDAARFYFKRRQWNILHLGLGSAGLAAALLLPNIWIGVPAMLAILGADLAVYFVQRNKDDRVGAASKWSTNPADWLKPKAKGKDEGKKKKAAQTQGLVFKGPGGAVAPPEKETPEYAVRAAAETLLTTAMDARGVRLELAPAGEGAYAFAYMVDGVRQTGEAMRAADAAAVIDFFKGAAGMDLQERRKKQQADLTLERLNIKHKLRLTAQGAQGGPALTIAIDPDKQVSRRLEDVGLLEGQLAEAKALVEEQKGVVLVATPAGGGRTTDLYAILRAHDAYINNVQTMELEPQAALDGVRHNVFDPMVDGAEYATTVRSILRRDPDVVAVAEMPDPQTAQEIARADHERTRVYLGLRADGALAAIQTYCKAVGDNAKASAGLHGVFAGKLLRRLCPNCKAAYQATPDMLKKLGLPGDKALTLHRKGGQVLVKNKPETCPMCAGSGYVGQDGVFEVHSIGAEERKMIAAADFAGLRAAFRKKRQPSIQECAVRKAADGVTSVEEVVRITQAPAAPAAAKPGAPAGGPASSGKAPTPQPPQRK